MDGCQHCLKEEPIIQTEINTWIPTFDDTVNTVTDYIVFIRGNQLCLGEKDDNNCMDHISCSEIKFCPQCGRKFI